LVVFKILNSRAHEVIVLVDLAFRRYIG
jgi:hypothetical protein